MSDFILAIDPGGKGGHTGIAQIGYGDDTPAYLMNSWAVEDDVDGLLSWWEDLELALGAKYVVCEHFVNRNVMGADLTPCFVEGAVLAMCFAYGLQSPILQPASGKDTAVPDEVLRRMGMYIPGDHHGDRRQAARHGLWFLKRMRHRPTLEKMYPPNID